MGKVIVTGPGRSGTTFVIRLFAHLGFDCGFEPGQAPYKEELRAGCEWQSGIDYEQSDPDVLRESIEAGPRFLKSPDWSVWLKELIRRDVLEVDHLVVPFRDLGVAARSRLDVGLGWLLPDDVDGHALEVQENIHAMALGRVVEAALLWSIPRTLMHLPLFVEDSNYCYERLSQVAKMDRREFDRAFVELARPEQIVWGE